MSFRGTFDYSLDAKNRLTVPSKFRPSLSDGVILAGATEPCIGIWAPSVFEAAIDARLANLHPLAPERDTITRFYSWNSFDTELDAAGRVMLPKQLLEAAGFRKEVVVTGAGDRLEVWDRATYGQRNAALAGEVAEIMKGFSHAA